MISYTKSLKYSVIPLFLTVMLGSPLACQTVAGNDPGYEDGFKPYGSFQVGDIDSINMVNRQLNLNIPLISFPQRGGKLHLGFFLKYSNMYLNAIGEQCGLPGMSTCLPGSVTPEGTGVNIASDFIDAYTPMYASGQSWSYVITPDGASHQVYQDTLFSRMIAVDGSGFAATPEYLTGSNCPGVVSTITDRSGVTTTQTCQPSSSTGEATGTTTITDGNGNQMTLLEAAGQSYPSNWTDSMGRSIPVVGTVIPSSSPANPLYNPNGDWLPTTTTSACTGTLPVLVAYVWTLPGVNAGSSRYTICYAAVYTNIPWACGNLGSACTYDRSAIWMIQSVVLPNGTAWTFQYDSLASSTASDIAYGDLLQITTPEGGSISYTWSDLEVPAEYCDDTGQTAYITGDVHRGVATRTVNANDGMGPHTWTYTQALQGSCSSTTDIPFTTTVTDPNGNATVHLMTDVDSTDNAEAFYETQANYYQGSASSGTLLKTVTTQYSYEKANVLPFVMDVLPSSMTTTLGGHSTTIRNSYDSGESLYAGGNSTYGNLTSKSIYDYSGALLQTTNISYQWQDNQNYLSANMVDLPATNAVLNAQGTTLSSTSYKYDEPAYLTGSGISIQHGTPISSVRGNQSTVTQALGAGGTVVTHTNWYDTGLPCQTIDARGNATTYGYSSSYIGAYNTNVTNVLSQTSSNAYDFNTGFKTQSIDVNQQHTTYAYDLMDRRTLVTFPDNGQITYCYNDLLSASCQGSTSGLSVLVSQKINSTTSKVQEYDVDGLGREIHWRLLSDPSGTEDVDTSYDAVGNIASVSNAYFASGSAGGYTSYAYDALRRVLLQCQPDNGTGSGGCVARNSYLQWSYSGNTTTFSDELRNSWQRTTDALGRLTNVIEPGSLVTSYGYDSLSNLLTVNQTGVSGDTARNRSFAYDSLSRLIAARNPETSSATTPPSLSCAGATGTTWTACYGYDANGNLTSKTDNRSIVTTYSYDPLNRLISKSYSSNANGSPSTCYQYDTAANGIGRLGNEWTLSPSKASCPTTTPFITQRSILAYDAMGRVLNEQQHTPANVASGTVYAPSYTYDLAGNLITSTDGTTPSPTTTPSGAALTFTNSYDGAGHLFSVTSNWADPTHPSPLFSLPTSPSVPCAGSSSSPYTPFGALQNATYGSGLTLNRGYDVRQRVNCENDVGGNTAATSGTATVTITGSEQTQ